jgi:hypothetical protein
MWIQTHRGFPACIVVWLAFAPAAIAQAPQSSQPFAGTVKKVTGDVVLRRGTDRIQVKEGLHLLAHDVLETPEGGSTGFILRDGTRVAMGANTTLEIDRYLFDPGTGSLGMLLRLVRGAMVYVSGKMSELSPESVRVETPVGVVGLRGTEFGVSLEAK